MRHVLRITTLLAALVSALWAVGAVHAAPPPDQYTIHNRAAIEKFVVRDFVKRERGQNRLVFTVHSVACVKLSPMRLACVLAVNGPQGPAFYTAALTCRTAATDCAIDYNALATPSAPKHAVKP